MQMVAPHMIDTVSAHSYEDLRRYDASAPTYILVNAVREVNSEVENTRAFASDAVVPGLPDSRSAASERHADCSATSMQTSNADVIIHAVTTLRELIRSMDDHALAHE